MDELMEKMANEMAAHVTAIVIERVRAELASSAKAGIEFGWLEEELAEKLGCSAQSLAKIRKDKLIDHSYNPANRPYYLPRHVFAYLLRQERRHGLNEPEKKVMQEVQGGKGVAALFN